jgi:hypothetical protein
MILIRIIILFFILLFAFQLYSRYNPTQEGLEMQPASNNSAPAATTSSSLTYQPYNSNDPNSALILSQQNAGNIEYLKGRVTDLEKSNTKIDAISQNMGSMQTQIDSLVQQQVEFAKELSTPAPANSEEPEEPV